MSTKETQEGQKSYMKVLVTCEYEEYNELEHMAGSLNKNKW
jgi:hypothetical protein